MIDGNQRAHDVVASKGRSRISRTVFPGAMIARAVSPCDLSRYARSARIFGVLPRSHDMSKGDFDPEYIFSHHPATPEKLVQYEAIHMAAKRFAQVLIDQVPECSDRSEALRLV